MKARCLHGFLASCVLVIYADAAPGGPPHAKTKTGTTLGGGPGLPGAQMPASALGRLPSPGAAITGAGGLEAAHGTGGSALGLGALGGGGGASLHLGGPRAGGLGPGALGSHGEHSERAGRLLHTGPKPSTLLHLNADAAPGGLPPAETKTGIPLRGGPGLRGGQMPASAIGRLPLPGAAISGTEGLEAAHGTGGSALGLGALGGGGGASLHLGGPRAAGLGPGALGSHGEHSEHAGRLLRTGHEPSTMLHVNADAAPGGPPHAKTKTGGTLGGGPGLPLAEMPALTIGRLPSPGPAISGAGNMFHAAHGTGGPALGLGALGGGGGASLHLGGPRAGGLGRGALGSHGDHSERADRLLHTGPKPSTLLYVNGPVPAEKADDLSLGIGGTGGGIHSLGSASSDGHIRASGGPGAGGLSSSLLRASGSASSPLLVAPSKQAIPPLQAPGSTMVVLTSGSGQRPGTAGEQSHISHRHGEGVLPPAHTAGVISTPPLNPLPFTLGSGNSGPLSELSQKKGAVRH